MIETLPKLPALPQPDMALFNGPLEKLKAAVDVFGQHIEHVNTSLAVSGFWVGMVTMAVLCLVIYWAKSPRRQ